MPEQLSETVASQEVPECKYVQVAALVLTDCAPETGHVIVGKVLSPTITDAVVVEKHALAVAVTVKTVVCKVAGSELVSVPFMVGPDPVTGIPVRVTVLSRVQVNEVPGIALGLVILIVVIGVPEHIVWVDGNASAVGIGLIVTVIG